MRSRSSFSDDFFESSASSIELAEVHPRRGASSDDEANQRIMCEPDWFEEDHQDEGDGDNGFTTIFLSSTLTPTQTTTMTANSCNDYSTPIQDIDSS
uniref:Uncharacterized protein n=1 Tax=Pristionchus pacificus TaxID=54126 RepID=A0A2A6CCU1_PRIPA|eukprot:PDM75821.1 hypothetical protein PRIPAC_40200 [Pristionchus pacificus]